VDESLASAITIVVVNRDHRPVDGQLLEVRAAISVQLCIKIGEDTSLQEGIFGEVDSSYDVTWLKLGGCVSTFCFFYIRPVSIMNNNETLGGIGWNKMRKHAEIVRTP
jgi:hypothetical protein